MVVGGVPGDLTRIAIALAAIAFISAFMTHLNIITDRELDLIKKPHLYRMLSSDQRVMNIALLAEAIVPVGGIIYLMVGGNLATGVSILLFLIVTVLYSYNFFSRHPRRTRWKVYWHGHFFVLIVGYMALWYAGYYMSSTGGGLSWFPVFLGISLSEYGLFLFESSVDINEEKAHKLKSMAAIMGAVRTVYISLGISVVAVLLIAASAWGAAEAAVILYGFLPPAVFITLFLTVAALRIGTGAGLMYKIPDIIFNLGRIYIVLACIYLKYIVV